MKGVWVEYMAQGNIGYFKRLDGKIRICNKDISQTYHDEDLSAPYLQGKMFNNVAPHIFEL